MKKIRWTPILVMAPIITAINIIELLKATWTPFSILVIILIPLIMGILLLLDRAFAPSVKPLTIWIVEIIIIIILIKYIWF